jgi:hypothetical protein
LAGQKIKSPICINFSATVAKAKQSLCGGALEFLSRGGLQDGSSQERICHLFVRNLKDYLGTRRLEFLLAEMCNKLDDGE